MQMKAATWKFQGNFGANPLGHPGGRSRNGITIY